MRDKRLLDYYNRELRYLRALGDEFARSYRNVADRLRLGRDRAEDPHVERLLQGVAFLTARVHLRIDDDTPELSQALLNVVYPHYLRPTPAMAIAQFRPDEGSLTVARAFPRGTRVISPPTQAGQRFRFRTCYDTTLLPITVADAGWHAPHEVRAPVTTDAVAVLRVDLSSTETTFDELDLSRLRFYLDGDQELIGGLYELLLNNCAEVIAWNPSLGHAGPVLRLPGSCVRPVGFEPGEAMLPATRRTFHPYQLLHDYFAFPKKFHFVDVTELEERKKALRGVADLDEGKSGASFGDELQLLFLMSPFERAERHATLQQGVDRRTLRLSCTPVVNLYGAEARPIPLTHKKSEYPLSVARDAEVFSVERVYASVSGSTESVVFQPLYAPGHGASHEAFWYARREPRDWSQDSASDVFISFVDRAGVTMRPGHHNAFADVLCSDGDLPHEMLHSGAVLHLEDEGMAVELLSAPSHSREPPVDRIDRRSRPRHRQDDRPETTASLRPAGGGRQHWRLVSMLSLNHLSLVEEGVDAFREMLRLHDPGTESGDMHIDAILRVSSEPMQSAVHGEYGLSFARGRDVQIELDEELFAGAGVYLFTSVIERFLGMYASINSFSRLVAYTRQRNRPLRTWPPRAGLKPLL